MKDFIKINDSYWVAWKHIQVILLNGKRLKIIMLNGVSLEADFESYEEVVRFRKECLKDE